MNEINSLTHSCMHSFASFAIFAFSGRAVFMMRATGAKLRMLASDAALFVLLDPSCGGDGDVCGEDDMAAAAGRPFSRHTRTLIRTFDEASARSQSKWTSSDAGREQSSDVQTGSCCAQIKTTGRAGGMKTHHLRLEAIGLVP